MSKFNNAIKVATDPRWWPFYAQRRVLTPARRNMIAGIVARRRPKAGITAPLPASAGATDLNRTGIHSLGQLLSPAQCAQLRGYFSGKSVFDPYRPRQPEFLPGSNSRDSQAHIAHHRPADIIQAPWLLEVANSPRMLDIASAYLECKPTIGYMACWWSYPTNIGPQQAEKCHRDVDDWRFVKLFLYLTDVGPDSGPHVYVRGSANDPRLVELRRFEDQEVIDTFGTDNILTMTGEAGEGFFENTFGIHKGQPVEQGERLIFQVVYSLNPLPYSPKQPVGPNPDQDRFDAWINRLYLR
jgi:hypothetical protein